MSHESARAWLAENAPDLAIVDNGESTATVAEAARAIGVPPERIAKTLALRVGGEPFLLVTRGDARLDNAKAKAAFGGRPRMLSVEETFAATGHAVGGVCPFGLANPLPVYCDVSLRPYEEVFPAAGSLTTSVRVSPERLAGLVSSGWVDVCRVPDGPPPQAGLGEVPA
jgi:prolyl-tRNA editing enzyme YbaK/EbsC (Cys-tRNA(Pro) deacylase)